jgi:archaemetzincin
MFLKLSSILFFALFLISCNEQKFEVNTKKNSSIRNTKSKTKITIVIQPFEAFPTSSANFIAKELKKIYLGSVIVKTAIPFPRNTLNQNKTRHRADFLIKYLSSVTRKGYLTMGLTNKDISTTKGIYLDWGIMGLGYCPGKSCIASTYRLKGNNQLEKLFKVAIHELGHTQGLKHCPVKTCLMADAEGKDRLNEKNGFCVICKSILIQSGWELI